METGLSLDSHVDCQTAPVFYLRDIVILPCSQCAGVVFVHVQVLFELIKTRNRRLGCEKASALQ